MSILSMLRSEQRLGVSNDVHVLYKDLTAEQQVTQRVRREGSVCYLKLVTISDEVVINDTQLLLAMRHLYCVTTEDYT